MYVGFFSGYAFRIYYDDDIKVPIMLTVIMDTFYNLAVYGLQFLLRGRLGLGTYFTRIIRKKRQGTFALPTGLCYNEKH